MTFRRTCLAVGLGTGFDVVARHAPVHPPDRVDRVDAGEIPSPEEV